MLVGRARPCFTLSPHPFLTPLPSPSPPPTLSCHCCLLLLLLLPLLPIAGLPIAYWSHCCSLLPPLLLLPTRAVAAAAYWCCRWSCRLQLQGGHCCLPHLCWCAAAAAARHPLCTGIMSISSDEVNYLVYRYLLESGTAAPRPPLPAQCPAHSQPRPPPSPHRVWTRGIHVCARVAGGAVGGGRDGCAARRAAHLPAEGPAVHPD